MTEQGKPVLEQLAARCVVAFSMVLIGVFSLIRFLPSPTALPDYARFLPAESAVETEATPEPVGERGRDPAPATAATATVTVESANCRERPRGGGDVITILYKDQEVEIVGRNADVTNPWWYIKIPNSSGHCWLWGRTSTMRGSISNIPVMP